VNDSEMKLRTKTFCTPHCATVPRVATFGRGASYRETNSSFWDLCGCELSCGVSIAFPAGIYCKTWGVVLEEADETVFWLELLAECNIVARAKLDDLTREANELTSIFVCSLRTAKKAHALTKE
jgi:hypothetical protein